MAKINGSEINLDTRTRTYEDHRQTMIDAIPILSPEWTDLYPHDPGVVILELLASQLDTLQYYIDRAVGESHLITAARLKSARDLATLVGYNPRLNSAATVELTLQASSLGATLYGIDSVTEAPFQVSTSTSRTAPLFTFELESEVTVDSTTMTLLFVEGKTVQNELVGTSNGRPGQSYKLIKPNITFSSSGGAHIKVKVSDGVTTDYWTYTQDTSFINYGESDKVFRVDVDSSGFSTILFGDGTNGAIPPSSFNIVVTYRVGGGEAANSVGVGQINKLVSTYGSITSCTNASKPTGGLTRDNVLQIKRNAPAVWSTQNRVISNADYDAIAGSISGVYKVKSVPYEGRPTEQAVYVAVDGDSPTVPGIWDIRKQNGTGLKGEIGRAIKAKSPAGIRLRVMDFTPLYVEVDVSVKLLSNYVQSDIRNKVVNAIRNHIRNNETDSVLPLSSLYSDIRDIVGVDYVTINKHRRIPYGESVVTGLADSEFSNIVVGQSTLNETFNITFTGQTSFDVNGSQSGPHSSGIINVVYTSNNGEIRFTISSGTYPNKALDQYKVVTTKNVDNITIQDNEIPIYIADGVNVDIVGGIAG